MTLTLPVHTSISLSWFPHPLDERCWKGELTYTWDLAHSRCSANTSSLPFTVNTQASGAAGALERWCMSPAAESFINRSPEGAGIWPNRGWAGWGLGGV